MSDNALSDSLNTRHSRSRKSRSRKSRSSFGLAKILMLLAGLIILVLGLPPFFTFPWLGYWLLPLAGIYFCVLFLLPRVWLVVLPLATVGIDITPWTGRFAYNELDLLFLITISSGLIFGRYRFAVFAPSASTMTLLAYILVMSLGFSGWILFALPQQTSFINPYYGAEYGYSLLKGLFWGVALVPMWGYLLSYEKDRTVNTLVAGFSAAAVLLGLIIMWELGTLGVVFTGKTGEHVLSSLPDLRSAYQVTGIFSDMHSGGAALEGISLLLLPISMHGMVYGGKPLMRIFAFGGFLSLVYIAAAGFSLSAYLAFTFVFLLYLSLTLFARKKAGLPPPLAWSLLLGSICLAAFTAVAALHHAGIYGAAIFASLLVIAFSASASKVSQLGKRALTGLAVGLLLCAAIAPFDGSGILWRLVATVSLAASYVVALQVFAQTSKISKFDHRFSLYIACLVPIVFSSALGEVEYSQRAATAAKNLVMQKNHWVDVIDSTRGGLYSQIFGNGVGKFPISYLSSNSERVGHVGSFRVVKAKRRNMLRVEGGSDLIIGQRSTISPFINYTVDIELSAESAGSLLVSLCERNMIYSGVSKPYCSQERLNFEATDGAFQAYSIVINSEQVGQQQSIVRWPTVLTVQYDTVDRVLAFGSISLLSDDINQLRNSSFKQGLDYWLSYNDVEHQPWHVQNMFLQLWFENGFLGLGLFLALLYFLLRTNVDSHAQGSLTPVYTTAVVGLCLFGIFASPLDSARVSWMYYFFLSAGLAKLRLKRTSRSRKVSVNGR